MAVYRRKNILINKNFQFRIAFYICGWVLALSFIYPILIINLFDIYVQYLAVDSNGPLLSALIDHRQRFLFFLISFEIVFVSISFLGALFISHRIAGPLYQLHNVLKRFQKGIWTQPVFFRKKDYFQPLAADANELQEYLFKRFSLKNEQIQNAYKALEKIADAKTVKTEIAMELEKVILELKNAESN
jgi:hypothetical protein